MGVVVTVDVVADGDALVSRAGRALLVQVAGKMRLTRAVSLRLSGLKHGARALDLGALRAGCGGDAGRRR
jgi:hypothetical protein